MLKQHQANDKKDLLSKQNLIDEKEDVNKVLTKELDINKNNINE